LQAKEAAELKIASEKERQVQLTTDADQYGKKLSEFEKEMGGLADEIAGLKKVVQSLEKSEIEAKETEKFLVQKSKKLKKTLKQDTLQQSEDETWIENFAEDVDQSQTKVDELSKKLKTEESKLTEIQLELQGKTQIYQTQISAKQVELEPLIEKCNSLKSKIDVLQSEKDLLNKKMQELSAVCESSKAKYAELLDCLDAKRAQQSEKKTDIKALNDAVQFKAADLSSLKSSREKLKIELKEVNEKMHDFKSNFESSLSRGKVHAELMKQKKQGKIKGICGRLGDLGYIDDKYDIAISTACGALDSIVVETVKDGQDCIEFLKHSNIGRATFICLDKLQKFNMDPISTPEKVARLFDLIKPNESRFLPAFYHGVSDTLVANDLQQANRVAYGKTRFRVVTLDGQLIDKSGTMSGGGSKPQKGGMNSKKAAFKDSGSNLVELETAQQDLSSKIDHVNNKIKAEEQTLKDQEKECKQAKNELKKLDLDINSLDLEIQDAKKAIEMAEQNSSPDSRDLRRISDLEKEIAKLLDLYSATEPSMIMGQQEISDLEEKILDIGGVRLRSQQSMVDGLKEQIQSFTEKVAKLLAEKSIRQKSLKKLLDAINKKTEELDQVEKQLDEFQSTTRDRFRELETERDRLKEMEEVMSVNYRNGNQKVKV
jgi:structural maintenance of chromosome 4